MPLLEGADLLEQEARPGRKVRPGLVFSLLGALVVAVLAFAVVRVATPRDPQPVRDSLRVPPDPDGPYSLDPVRRISADHAAGMTSEPWQLLGIDGRPHSLQIYFVIGGGCETPVGIRVHETATRVTIEAVSRTDPSASACASLLKTDSGTVILKRPLGRRELWHAPVEPGNADLLRS